jgi:D-alanyl-D-alanine carboxypeptidase
MSTHRGSSKNQSGSKGLRLGLVLLIGLSLAGLLWVTARSAALAQATIPPTASVAPTLTTVHLPATATQAATPLPPATATPDSTHTPTAEPTGTPLPAATQTALHLASCPDDAHVEPDLLTYVNRDVALERDFEPADLEVAPLEAKNLYYRPISLRTSVHRPLLDLVEAMNEAGLEVWVMSGYRSYSEQTLAFEKWQALYPERAAEISAVPGHSEHQLGTAVDFSAPYMDDLYGDYFNTRFNQTAEGQWLQQHAAAYGFTLSYPSGAVEETGYAWEPWHYRYVGSLAMELETRQMTLTRFFKQCAPQLSQ